MTKFFHSIRWRVQVWHALILLLAVGVLWLTAYQLAWDNQLRRIDKELTATERSLIKGLLRSTQAVASQGAGASKEEPPPIRPSEFVERIRSAALPAETAMLFEGDEPGFAYFSLRDREGKVLQESRNVPEDVLLLPAPEADLAEEVRTVGARREFSRSSSHGLRGVVGRDITPEVEEMHRYGWSLSVFCGGIWTVGLAGGWWLAGRAIRPVEAISRTASRIAEGNLEERIDTQGTDSELDQLGRVLNQTFERLHTAFERQRQFTADASHELRTPVTILLTETQRILKRERSGGEYREALETCRETAERMRRLIEALLLLARQGAGEWQAPVEVVDLARAWSDTVRQLTPLAMEKEVVIWSDLQRAECWVHADALSILLTNLLMNAIQHHRRGGTIEITCGVKAREAVFAVRDDGPGIPAADLPHIFERFFRADKARTGSGEHAGLGLAVARMIVKENGGTIDVRSEEGKGTVFEVCFPLALAAIGGREAA